MVITLVVAAWLIGVAALIWWWRFFASDLVGLSESQLQAHEAKSVRVKNAIIFFAAILGGLGAYVYQSNNSTSALATTEDVRNYLQGTWSHTQPVIEGREPYGWERWSFNQNGVRIQDASPSDTKWGEPATYGYLIEKSKTSDTGEWYWRINVTGTAVALALFRPDDTLRVMRLGAANQYQLVKADRDLAK